MFTRIGAAVIAAAALTTLVTPSAMADDKIKGNCGPKICMAAKIRYEQGYWPRIEDMTVSTRDGGRVDLRGVSAAVGGGFDQWEKNSSKKFWNVGQSRYWGAEICGEGWTNGRMIDRTCVEV
ncbi:hypothetical protein [Allokutzneria albata]|uniref:Peptidase inhibitor family I36 n=1 Tax=Allokutzneria albata TaxID=211114 RepID=A0A1G9ZRN0_ALLAB|nr:hypothetical protein [Allokutzneria albata]SDN23988.1 hypothetical protein SAMN04489726_5671 [Allokutzneria albata]